MSELYEKFYKRLKDKDVIILDGGVGTELQKRGIEMDAAWCGAASRHEKILTQIHSDYISAGCEIITTNTYASGRIMLQAANLEDHFEEINAKAIKASISAREKVPEKEILIAGSLSHRFPINDGDKQSRPDDKITDIKFEASCNELSDLLAAKGCDLIILEMMYHPKRIRTVVQAAFNSGLPVWAGFSTRRGKNGSILSAMDEEAVFFDEILSIVEDFNFDAVGVMHTHVNDISDTLAILKNKYSLPLMVYPDSGGWVSPNWDFEKVIKPDEFQKLTKSWVKEGAQIIGGCCGLSPAHISAISVLKKKG